MITHDSAVTVTEIDAAADEIAKCYDLLPPKAKARLALLAMTLAKIRNRLLKPMKKMKPIVRPVFSATKKRLHIATGKRATHKWEMRSGDEGPIAGSSLEALEARLAKL